MTVRAQTAIRKQIATDAASAQPLRELTAQALRNYFARLNGHSPHELYDLVIREVERPLLETVMEHTDGNQTLAADMLGISRGTLRKKLRDFGISR